LEDNLEEKFWNMKGAADAAHGTADGTLRGAGSTMARAEGMKAGTSRFVEAGLKGQAADMAEVGMDLVGLAASGAALAGNSGRGASGCSTPERSGW
jgi:hypothetical protein